MHISAALIPTLALLTSSSPTPGSPSPNQLPRGRIRNANHIFNTLHSSMRQWGSAWNHNGMSFFLASVPAGTQLYHGTRSAERVNGTEWLAFEPEHALNFARAGPRHPGGPDGPPYGPPGAVPWDLPGDGPPPFDIPPPPRQSFFTDGSNEEDEYGYLHTYIAAKDLRLLYIDGLSAGKTDMGTLDSGDRIFLRDSLTTSPFTDAEAQDPGKGKGPVGPPGEMQRALRGCQIAQNEWNDRIDGILRAEAGFEIIMCDFERDLEIARISAVLREEEGPIDRPGGGGGGGGFGMNSYFYRSIASRFNGIGGDRVKVNYDNFVTAYTYQELDLFAQSSGENGMPRLNHFESEELDPIRADLTKLVMEHDAAATAKSSFDWQGVVDMIVLKYSNLLAYLASEEVDSLQGLQSNVTSVFLAFIDSRERDADMESARCAGQFIPSSANASSLAGQVVYDVSYTICSTLRAVLDDTDFASAKTRILELVEYLAWTTWKECKTKCGYNETCYVPIWPFGTVEDRRNPQCKSQNEGRSGGEGYWKGGFGGGKPRAEAEHGEL
ncbi:hypothetical protein TCE0_033r09594 [Talaromyces pinophilus]|uniref:Uncharacterized protein n=1 Tax=Talaromyces pinophilus TaxID=128442 RepID=A0A6V8HB65_TALPI|nr:hypothetical protein TCE0_033r09594 [Talaromyces pinophilus]